MYVNPVTREINAKVVFFGLQGFEGAAAVRWLHQQVKPEQRTDFRVFDLHHARILVCTALVPARSSGWNLRLHLHCYEGDLGAPRDRQPLLRGCDVLVLCVPDGESPAGLRALRESAREGLAESGVGYESVLRVAMWSCGPSTPAEFRAQLVAALGLGDDDVVPIREERDRRALLRRAVDQLGDRMHGGDTDELPFPGAAEPLAPPPAPDLVAVGALQLQLPRWWQGSLPQTEGAVTSLRLMPVHGVAVELAVHAGAAGARERVLAAAATALHAGAGAPITVTIEGVELSGRLFDDARDFALAEVLVAVMGADVVRLQLGYVDEAARRGPLRDFVLIMLGAGLVRRMLEAPQAFR